MQNTTVEPDFSSPWHMSDVILVVEDQHLHAHRGILSMCSPVFEKMFNADFKEKHATEIPLPGKKADQVTELLLVLYPSAKPINETNVHFLLPLAHEYQINLVQERCEKYLLQRAKTDADVVKFLLVAQECDLKDLYKQCVDKATKIQLKDLRRLKDYTLINCEVGKEIAIGRVELFESEMRKLKNRFERFVGLFYSNEPVYSFGGVRGVGPTQCCNTWNMASQNIPKDTVTKSQIDDLMKGIEEMLSSSSSPF